MNGRRHNRGQAGLTIIELLLVISVGSIVLVPLFGLLNLTILRQDPTVDQAEGAKELRLFRNALADDWVEGRIIRVNAPDPVGFEFNCNGAGNAGGAANIKIAIMTSDGTDTSIDPLRFLAGHPTTPDPRDTATDNRRVLYKLTPATNPANGPFQLLRSECQHFQSGTTGIGAGVLWGLGRDIDSSTRVVVNRVSELRLPATCNPDFEPFTRCDMNVTLILANGDRTTLRLHQPVGRKS